jgi:hypothetical protein
MVVLLEISDGPPKWRPSALLPWHLAQFFWKTEFAVRFASDGGVWAKIVVSAKNKEHTTTAGRNIFMLHLAWTIGQEIGCNKRGAGWTGLGEFQNARENIGIQYCGFLALVLAGSLTSGAAC